MYDKQGDSCIVYMKIKEFKLEYFKQGEQLVVKGMRTGDRFHAKEISLKLNDKTGHRGEFILKEEN